MSQLSFKVDLKPTTDNAQFLGDSGHGWKIHRILAPTASSGATFGAGVDGQVLKTNGTTIYWGNDVNTQAVTGVKGNSETNYRTGNVNITAANIGLGNVENTKLSTWTGSSNITTLGTISTGTWNGTAIASGKISTLPTSKISGLGAAATADYGTSATKVSTSSGAGSATTVSRSDHVHSIDTASTSVYGITKLQDGISSNSTALAATANAALTAAKNVASSNSTSKLFLVGTTSQSSTGVTGYSHSGIYISGGILYTNNIRPISTTSTLLIAGGDGAAKILVGDADAALGYRDINFEANDYCFDTLYNTSGRMDINTKIYANSGIILAQGATGTGLTMRYSTSSGTTWEARSWADPICKFDVFAEYSFQGFGTKYKDPLTNGLMSNTDAGSFFYYISNASSAQTIEDDTGGGFLPFAQMGYYARFGSPTRHFDMWVGRASGYKGTMAIIGDQESSLDWYYVNNAISQGYGKSDSWFADFSTGAGFTAPNVYNSTYTLNAGGYARRGPYVYVQMSIKLASGIAANAGRNISTNIPYSSETPVIIPAIDGSGYSCGSLVISTAGTATFRATKAIASGTNIRFCGHYAANNSSHITT